MKVEEKVKQHYEILSELIHLNDIAQKRLRLVETIQAFSIPALIITGLSGVVALLMVLNVF